MALSMTNVRVSAFTGTQLRVQRPAAARPRASIVRAVVGKGEPQADQKAEDDVEQMGAPEGDRVLAGEKVQRGGSGESGEGGGETAKSTTPAGEESKKGVAKDKTEQAKGTY